MAQHVSAPHAPIRRAQGQGDDLARTRQFEWLARAGIAARGVIYAIIGVLAIKLAVGSGGETTNQQGALATIVKQPFGKALLILMAVGLAGYAIWRLVRAALGHGPEASRRHEGAHLRAVERDRLSRRSSSPRSRSCSGRAAVARATPARRPAACWTGPPDRSWSAIAGAVMIGVGLDQGYKGIKRKFLEKSKTGEMSEGVERAFTALGVFGHLARMVVFGLIGYFLIKAAIDYDPDKAVGLDGALAALRRSSYGPTLLGSSRPASSGSPPTRSLTPATGRSDPPVGRPIARASGLRSFA